MKFNFSSMRLGALAACTGLLTVLTFSACNKNNNDNDNVDVPAAGLMAFNLAPDIASAGVALSGNSLSNSLAYGSFTGTYLAVFTGSRPVESFNSASGNRLASGSFDFEDKKYYSLFVVGNNGNYSNVIVNDNFDSLSSNGQAYIRYINAIPDSSKPTVTFASAGSNVVNDNAAFSSVSEFKAVNAGDVTINVSNGGTIDANRTITLEARKVYTVLLSGVAGGTGANEVQIKYITNGTLDETAGKASSASARAAN